MAESKSKSDLVEEAQEAGVPDAETMTKAELEEQLASVHGVQVAPEALGPVIEEGETQPAYQASGRGTVGVQPLTADDIPESGR